MKIKAFKAMHPDPAWYNVLMNKEQESDLLRQMLEPSGNGCSSVETCKMNLTAMIANGQYQPQESPGIYIYEKESVFGSQFGVWVLTSLDDLTAGRIVTHERTLQEQEDRLKSYRTGLGLESSPVTLIYRRNQQISQLIEKVGPFEPIITLSQNNCRHKVWKISEAETIARFSEIFESIDRVYVADGHHRLAAAAANHDNVPQWITTLYISSGQVQCREFNKMVRPALNINTEWFLNEIRKCFFISPVPNNIPYRPTRRYRFGMCNKGKWYQLDLKQGLPLTNEVDVQILQSCILKSLFEIDDPRRDERLYHYPADRWEEMLSETEKYGGSIVFTLFPMTAEALIQQAEKQQDLPPKSTYIEPKIPFGLLLYQNEAVNQNLQETNG